MSAETIAVVISAAGLLLGFISAFAWMIRRSDAQFERLETRLGDRITGIERGLGDRITGVERGLGDRITEIERGLGDRITEIGRGLGDRITGVERELVEVKIAVARIEGPPRHLVTAR